MCQPLAADPLRYANRIFNLLVDNEPHYKEDFRWDEQLEKLTDEDQSAVVNYLLADLRVTNRMGLGQIVRSRVVTEILKSRPPSFIDAFEREVRQWAESAPRADQGGSRFTAQARAAADLGVSDQNVFSQPWNRDLRDRWYRRTDVLIDQARDDAKNRQIDPRAFQRWKAQQIKRLWVVLQQNIVHGLRALLGYRHNLSLLDVHSNAIRALEESDLDSAVIAIHEDEIEPPGISDPELTYVLTTANGRSFAIIYEDYISFSFLRSTYAPLRMSDLGEPSARGVQFVTDLRLAEIQRAADLLHSLPDRMTVDDLVRVVRNFARNARQHDHTSETLNDLLRIDHDSELSEPLFDLLVDLRFGGFANGQYFWAKRQILANNLNLPPFRLFTPKTTSRLVLRAATAGAEQSITKPKPPPRSERPLPTVRTSWPEGDAFAVDGELDAEVVRFEHPGYGNTGEWHPVSLNEGSPVVTVTSLKPIPIEQGWLAIPSAPGYELVSLGLKGRGRVWSAGDGYILFRNPGDGAYAARVTGSRAKRLHVTAQYKWVEPPPPVTLPTISGAKCQELSKQLGDAGETVLSTKLATASELSIPELSKLIKYATAYTYWTEVNRNKGGGPLAQFASFLDARGKLCGQCLHTAELLAHLLNQAFADEPRLVARVIGVRQNWFGHIRLEEHAVVDVYWDGKLVHRLDPTPIARDARAPSKDYVWREARAIELRELANTIHRARRDVLDGATDRDLRVITPDSPFSALYKFSGLAARLLDGQISLEHFKDDAAKVTKQSGFKRVKRPHVLLERLTEFLTEQSERAEHWSKGVPDPRPRDHLIQQFHLSRLGELNDLTEATRAACEGYLVPFAEAPRLDSDDL